MTFQLASVLDHSLEDFCRTMSQGFSDYFVPLPFDVALLARMVRYYGVDLQASRVLLRDGVAIGGALIGRRGWESRLGAMAIAPEARGQGGGTWMVQELIKESRARKERRMALEVIAQNPAAIHVYEKAGFTKRRHLLGLSWPDTTPVPSMVETPTLREIDFRQLAHHMNHAALQDLPWQIAPETFCNFGPPNEAFQQDHGLIAISSPDDDTIAIRGLWVAPEHRRKGHATRLVRAVMARYPTNTWKIPALFPEEIFGGFFEKLGFVKEELSQWQMLLDL